MVSKGLKEVRNLEIVYIRRLLGRIEKILETNEIYHLLREF
jgi:hypothetical protein